MGSHETCQIIFTSKCKTCENHGTRQSPCPHRRGSAYGRLSFRIAKSCRKNLKTSPPPRPPAPAIATRPSHYPGGPLGPAETAGHNLHRGLSQKPVHLAPEAHLAHTNDTPSLVDRGKGSSLVEDFHASECLVPKMLWNLWLCFGFLQV